MAPKARSGNRAKAKAKAAAVQPGSILDEELGGPVPPDAQTLNSSHHRLVCLRALVRAHGALGGVAASCRSVLCAQRARATKFSGERPASTSPCRRPRPHRGPCRLRGPPR
eukprot:11243636-Alexandrium_andersonii.AAC.1